VVVADDSPAAELADGVLAVPPHPEALAQVIDELLDDEHRRASLGQEARRIASERYHPRTMVDAYEALYDDVLEELR